jgi:hypothetical protein
MNEFDTGFDALTQSLAELMRSLGEHLPMLIAALLLIVVGWFVGRLLSAAFVRLGGAINTSLSRLSRSSNALQLSDNLLALLGNVVFWITLLVFTTIAARVAGLETLAGWLDRVLVYLPTLCVGGLIFLTGYLLSRLVRDSVMGILASTGSAEYELFGLLAQSAVVLTALVIGLDHIGIDVTFLIIVFAILLGGLLLSLSMAFGLGARDFVSNLIAANQAQRVVLPGQNVEIGDAAGRVLEITHTSVVLLTGKGRLVIPAKFFQEEATLIVLEDDDE